MTEYRSQLTEDDLASANRVWLSWRRSRKYYLVIFTIFFAVFAFSFVPKLETEDKTSIIVTLAFDTILAVAAISVITGLTYVLVPRRARKLFRQQKSLHAEASIGWSDKGFSYKSELTSSLHPWTHYRQWGENKDVLVMFLTDTQFNLVPKRDIPDGALEELKSLLAKAGIQRVGKRAKPAQKL
jgi:hypothetical protein